MKSLKNFNKTVKIYKLSMQLFQNKYKTLKGFEIVSNSAPIGCLNFKKQKTNKATRLLGWKMKAGLQVADTFKFRVR